MSQPSVTAAAPPLSPYVGLVPFDDTSAAYFHGRDLEIQLTITNLLANRLTVLHGVSAVGKTSLILAGVLPRLRHAEEHNAQRQAVPLRILYQREWSGSMSELLAKFRTDHGLTKPEKETGPEEIFDFPRDHRVLLILDQFEEFFRYQTVPPLQGTFLRILLQSLRGHPQLHLLISLRDDALAQLDILKTSLPGLFDNMLRIEHLGLEGARQAIRQPLQKWTEEYGHGRESWEAEDALVENLIEQTRVGSQSISTLRGGVQSSKTKTIDRVEVAYLQLCLEKLWALHLGGWKTQTGVNPPFVIHRLTNDVLVKAKNASGIIDSHIHDRIQLLDPVERELFAAMTRQLITPELQKYAHSVHNLTVNARDGFDFKEADLARIPGLLKALGAANTRLLREISDSGGGALKYEIFHDLLAKGLVGWRDKIIGERKGRREQKQVWSKFALLGSAAAAIICAWFAHDARKQKAFAEQQKAHAEDRTRETIAANAAEREADKIVRENALAESEEKKRDAIEARAEIALKQTEIDRLVKALNDIKKQTTDLSTGHGIEKVINTLNTPLIARLAGASASVRACSYSPDGRYVALGSEDRKLRLYPRQGGNLLAEGIASSTAGGVTAIAFSPDGAFLLTGSEGGSVRLFDPRLKDLGQGKELPSNLNIITSLAFSRDGKLSVATDTDGEVAVLDWSSYPKQLPKGISRFQHGSIVSYAAFSPDGQRLVISGEVPNRIRVLRTDVSPLTELSVQFGGSIIVPEKVGAPTRRLRFSPNNPDLIIGGAGRALLSVSLLGDRMTYIRDSAAAGPFFHASGGVVDTAFSPDGTRVVSIGTDGQCLLWDAGTAKSLARIPTRLHGRLLSIGWQAIQDKSLLALGGEDGRLELWDLSGPGLPDESTTPVFEVQAHAGPLIGLRFDPLNEQLMTWDGFVNVNTPGRAPGSPADVRWKAWKESLEPMEAAFIPRYQPALWSLPNALRKSSAP